MARRRRGSILKRGSVFYIKYSVLGRARMERAGSSVSEAQRLLAQRHAEFDAGAYRVGRVVTFDVFMDRFWTEHVEPAGLKPSTKSAYASVIRRHLIPWFGPLRLDKISPAHIQQFVAETLKKPSEATGRVLSPKTFRNALRILSKVFACAVDWHLVARTPVQRITLPRAQHREMDFLRPDEVQRLLAAARDEEDRCLFSMAIFTGLRQGELLALEWKHLDLERRVVRVRQAFSAGKLLTPKTKNGIRDVRIGSNLAEALVRHKTRVGERSSFVFSNQEGRHLDAANIVKRLFQPALERAGLRRLRWHDCRHTFASLLLDSGANIKFVSTQLGHASVQLTLDTYSHLIPETYDWAIDKLDALAHVARGEGNAPSEAN